MTPKGADLEATDLIEVSTIESGSYVTRSITGQELIDAIPLPPTSLTVGTTPIASGTIGRVLFQGTGNVLQQSSSLFWDNTNARLGIGTSTPLTPFDVISTDATILLRNTSSTGFAGVNMLDDTNTLTGSFQIGGSGVGSGLAGNMFIGARKTNGNLLFVRGAAATISATLFGSTGNLAINTTTDAGFRLDVNGTARVSGNTTINAALTVAVSNLPVFNLLDTLINHNWQLRSNGGSLWFIANGANNVQFRTNGNVLIGTTTDAGFRLDVNGTARVTGNFNVSGGQGITTISPNTITGGTDFFVVRTSSLGTFITARENGNLILGPTAGSRLISYEALSFSHRSLSSMAFNNGGAWVPLNQLNQAGMYINANYTNAGAGGTSEGAIFQFQGNTATTIGNVTLNQISMKPTYNNTGGTTINRGFFYDPTLTSMTNTTHYAFHSTSGRIRFENLPTSATGLNTGDLWNDGGTLKIV